VAVLPVPIVELRVLADRRAREVRQRAGDVERAVLALHEELGVGIVDDVGLDVASGVRTGPVVVPDRALLRRPKDTCSRRRCRRTPSCRPRLGDVAVGGADDRHDRIAIVDGRSVGGCDPARRLIERWRSTGAAKQFTEAEGALYVRHANSTFEGTFTARRGGQVARE
jgi:hypothetical protein